MTKRAPRRRAGSALVAVALVCGTCATGASVAGAQAVTVSDGINPSTYSFLQAPTDQLGVPGYAAGSELTPQAGIYTGQVTVDWTYGAALRPLPILFRRLAPGSQAPVDALEAESGGIRYDLTVFSAAVAGDEVDFLRVRMTNRSTRAATAGWGTHLSFLGVAPPVRNSTFRYRFAPLVSENPSWTYVRDGPALTRAGEDLVFAPLGGSGDGDDDVTYTRSLAPGAHWTLDFMIPVVPVDDGGSAASAIAAASLTDALAETRVSWHRFFGSAMAISLPESKVTDTFYDSLAVMEQSRYPAPPGQPGWIQTPNKLQYNAFFIRDAAFIARAFDVAGLHEEADQDLDYFSQVQSADGQFSSQPGQLDAQGEALWALGQHAAWPGPDQAAYARSVLPEVQAGVAWLASACSNDPLGLVPVSTLTDNELTSGHITGDDFMAVDGLWEAVALAKLAGRPDLALQWNAQLTQLEIDLRGALADTEARTGGWIPPALEDDGGQNWGNLWMTYPLAVAMTPRQPAVTATLDHVLRTFRQGIATYQGFLHSYLGFRVFETELQRGQQTDVVDGLYAELAHTTATGGAFETDVKNHGPRVALTNLAPHGWFAAEYVTLLRNMLVDESGSDAVDIMSAVSPDWLTPGRVISVRDAPTTAGSVSYRLVSGRGGARLTWSTHLRAGVKLLWPMPAATGLKRTVTLDGSRGSLMVHWTLHGVVPSFTRTAAALLKLYRR